LRHWQTNLVRTAMLASAVLALAWAASAGDRIRRKDGIGLNGQIEGVTESGLRIKIGSIRQIIPFSEIASVSSDDYPKLKEAEALYEQAVADGSDAKAEAMQKAAKLYDGLLTKTAPPWLRTVVQWRMYKVYAASGEVQKALDAYLAMAKQSPKLVADLTLPAPVPDQHEANRAMLKQVEKVLSSAGNAPYADVLRNFHVSLQLLEGDPKEVLESGVLDKPLASPDPEVRQSAMFRKMELLVLLGRDDEAAAWLEKIQTSEPNANPAEMAYWSGRVLEKQNKPIEAALAFMRLPILYPRMNPQRTADALWRAGKALEAAQAPKAEVAVVYQEAVSDYAGTQGAERARRELARLGAK